MIQVIHMRCVVCLVMVVEHDRITFIRECNWSHAGSTVKTHVVTGTAQEPSKWKFQVCPGLSSSDYKINWITIQPRSMSEAYLHQYNEVADSEVVDQDKVKGKYPFHHSTWKDTYIKLVNMQETHGDLLRSTFLSGGTLHMSHSMFQESFDPRP